MNVHMVLDMVMVFMVVTGVVVIKVMLKLRSGGNRMKPNKSNCDTGLFFTCVNDNKWYSSFSYKGKLVFKIRVPFILVKFVSRGL